MSDMRSLTRIGLLAAAASLPLLLVLAVSGGGDGSGSARAGEPTSTQQFLTAVTEDVDSYWTKVFDESGLPEPRVRYMWIPPGRTAASACGATDPRCSE